MVHDRLWGSVAFVAVTTFATFAAFAAMTARDVVHATAASAQTPAAPPRLPAPAGQSAPTPSPGQPQSPAGQAPPPGTGPARDRTQPPTAATSGTAIIRGRVLALDSGRPLRRVQVTAIVDGGHRPRATLTDAEGRFEFKALPAGRYSLGAFKVGYVRLGYGQRGPRDAGRPLDVSDGQKLEKIDFYLPRGGVIAGRIVDDYGEPLAGMAVNAYQYRVTGGQRRLSPTMGATTDDLGQFRIFGLPPGEYYVGAKVMNAMLDDQSVDSSGFAPTYYPGTANMAEAQRVTVGIGEEASADFAMTVTRLARISGTAVDSAGKPLTSGAVQLVRAGDFMMVEGGMFVAHVDSDGAFVLSSVPPGSYTVVASLPGGSPDHPGERAKQAVTVAGEDVTDVRLVTSKGGSLKGRLVYDGGTPASGKPPLVTCRPAEVEMFGLSAGNRPTPAREDQTFELTGIFGPCVLTAVLSDWMVKSVRQGGVDVQEKPIDVPPMKAIDDFEIVLTNRLPTLTGTVTASDGSPVKEYVAIVFPEDRERWTSMPATLSGLIRIRSVRPDQAGVFKISPLPPGDYLAVALDAFPQGDEQDPEVLGRLEKIATPAQLTEGGTVTVTLPLSKLPQP